MAMGRRTLLTEPHRYLQNGGVRPNDRYGVQLQKHTAHRGTEAETFIRTGGGGSGDALTHYPSQQATQTEHRQQLPVTTST